MMQIASTQSPATSGGTGMPAGGLDACRQMLDALLAILTALALQEAAGRSAHDDRIVIRPCQGNAPARPQPCSQAVIHVVDDDARQRENLRQLLEQAGRRVTLHASAEAFLADHGAGHGADGEACLLLDAEAPGSSGFALLRRLRDAGDAVPAIMLTGISDVPAAVAAILAGAMDVVEKPVRGAALLDSIVRTLERARELGRQAAARDAASGRLAALTPRQRAVLERVLAGEPSKNIAVDLGISRRTVETHRAAIMHRTGMRSLPALARLAVAAAPPAMAQL